VLHVYGVSGNCGKRYDVQAESEVKARAKGKALYWDDFKEAAIAVEWVNKRFGSKMVG